MNILLINHYAGSIYHGMEFRPYYLAREWQKAGHKVTIVAASEAHVRNMSEIMVHNLKRTVIDGIDYLWLKTPQYSGNGLKRAINMAVFIYRLFQNIRKVLAISKPNIVVASSTYPADIFPAYYFAKKSVSKLIYEVHDLWPLSPIELGGMSKFHPFILFMQAAEDFSYRFADAVVSMLPKTLGYMQGRGLIASKWHYIPNGISLEEWQHAPSIPKSLESLIKDEKEKGRFLVAYCGAHGLANSLSTLIDTASLMRSEPVSFFLIGKGPEKIRLLEQTQKLKLTNVFFHDHIDKNMIPTLLTRFDSLFISLKRQSLFRFGISPNKLIDYMMAGRPIIQAIEAGNDMVSEARCGISIQPENPEAAASAIKQLMSLSVSALAEMGINGKNYVLQHHDYSVLANDFLKVMNGILRG